MLSRKDTLTILTNNLHTKTPFIFTKFGDGEIACMNGEVGHNCDRHPYSENLGVHLIDSFLYLTSEDYCYIAKWVDDEYKDILRNKWPVEFDNWVEYDTMLHVEGQLDGYIKGFMSRLKSDVRIKVFVGPERLSGVNKLLDIDYHIIIPTINAYSVCDKAYNMMESLAKNHPDVIFIFSSGMMAKVLISDIHKKYKKCTFIDMGSSFDPIFVGKTRLKQCEREELINFYKEML